MMSLQEDIKQLIELQKIDLQVRRLDDEMAAGLAEIEKRRARIENHRSEMQELEERRVACEARKKELETLIEEEFAKIKDRQTKMMNVQTNREYQSLLKEIEDGKEANRQREDESVLLMEEIESINKQYTELRNVCEAEEKLLKEEEANAANQASELQGEKEKIIKSRASKAKKVKANVLKRYELLRERRNGLAIVGVSNGVCLGCNMNIPPQMFNNLMRADELLSCPICNRMMFYQPVEEKEN